MTLSSQPSQPHVAPVIAPPYLTDTEVESMCEPLVQPHAQVRHLQSLGLLVTRKPNGRPLVLRSELDRVLGAGRFAAAAAVANHTAPNAAGLRNHLNQRGRHGAQA